MRAKSWHLGSAPPSAAAGGEEVKGASPVVQVGLGLSIAADGFENKSEGAPN